MKIVSLLPSATEIVCTLGLRDQLVGVSHECDYPGSVADLPRVTRSLVAHDASSRSIDKQVRQHLQEERALYTLDMPVLAELKPDLVVSQTLCEVCAVAADEIRTATRSLPGPPHVVNLEPTCLDEIFESLRLVGEAADRRQRAEDEIAALQNRVRAVTERSRQVADVPGVVVLEWIDPPFSCGHWNPQLVTLAGGHEMIGVEGRRSRTIEWHQVVDADPDVLMLVCCGFNVERTLLDLPILQGYPGWRSLRCVERGRVYVVDGSAYFSRPGPRLVDSLEILAHALHPGIHPLPSGLPHAQQVA